jgi:hypothetical protein
MAAGPSLTLGIGDILPVLGPQGAGGRSQAPAGVGRWCAFGAGHVKIGTRRPRVTLWARQPTSTGREKRTAKGG